MWEVILLIVLILLSGFFSGIEIAFMSISVLRIKYLVNNNVKNSRILERLRRDPQRLLILILIGNNIVNIGASAIATSLAIRTFGNAGVGIATGVMTFLVLVFGEITPKAYCTQNAEKVALKVSPAMLIISKILWPLVEIFNSITMLTTKVFKTSSKKPLITEDEVRNIVSLGEEEGSIKKSESEMINNVFRFDDTNVGSIMVPRPDIFAIDGDSTVEEVIDKIVEEGFSRIPVYEENLDSVKGVLFIKDLLKAGREQRLKELVREPLVVPESKKTNALFQEMNMKKIHIALVINEHGSLVGLVTIEDIVEEIVGEIYDETDEIRRQIKTINKKTFLVDGDTEIKRINKKLGLSLKGNVHKNLSAFILAKLENIPSKGDNFTLPDCDIIIDDVEKNRITTVKIVKK